MTEPVVGKWGKIGMVNRRTHHPALKMYHHSLGEIMLGNGLRTTTHKSIREPNIK